MRRRRRLRGRKRIWDMVQACRGVRTGQTCFGERNASGGRVREGAGKPGIGSSVSYETPVSAEATLPSDSWRRRREQRWDTGRGRRGHARGLRRQEQVRALAAGLVPDSAAAKGAGTGLGLGATSGTGLGTEAGSTMSAAWGCGNVGGEGGAPDKAGTGSTLGGGGVGV